MIRKTPLLGLAALTFGLSCMAYADLSFTAKKSLVVYNNTYFPSTAKINNKNNKAKCSSSLPGNYGITPPNSKNEIPYEIMWLACSANRNACQADVYMTNDCSGPVIASVTVDIESGIQIISNLYGEQGFTIKNPPIDPLDPLAPFTIIIEGGPQPA